MNPNLANEAPAYEAPTITYSVVAYGDYPSAWASVMYVSTSKVKAVRECARMVRARTERTEGVGYLVSVCALN
jgi:hypothetical protein